MNAGLLQDYDEWRINLTISSQTLDFDGVNSVTNQISLISRDTSSGALATGYNLTIQNYISVATTGTTVATLDIPSLAISDTYNNGVNGGLELNTHVIFYTGKLETTTARLCKNKITSIEWYVNGVLYKTYAGPYSPTSAIRMVPSAIPLIGSPASVSALSSRGGSLPSWPYPILEQNTIEGASCSGTCGYQWKPTGGAYVNLPIEIYAINYLPLAGTSCMDTPENHPTGTTTNDVVVSSHAQIKYTSESFAITCPCPPPDLLNTVDIEYFTGTVEYISDHNEVDIFPNLPKEFIKFEDEPDDFRELIYRSDSPEVRINRTSQCDFGTSLMSYTTISDSDYISMYANYSNFLATVRSADHIIHETLLPPTYCLFSKSNNYFIGSGLTITLADSRCAAGPPSSDDCVPAESYDFCSFTSNVNCQNTEIGVLNGTLEYDAGGLYDYLMRYSNSMWCSPFWSFHEYQEDWSAFPFSTYWGKRRQKWIKNAGLPVGENLETRNNNVSSPLVDSRFYTNIIADFGHSFHLGPRIHHDINVVTDENVTSASSSLWTFTDCTAVFNASDITLTPSAAQIVAKLSLGSFTVNPFMIHHIARKVFVDWIATNISNVTVNLISSDGVSVTLKVLPSDTYTTPNVYYLKPILANVKQGGSWAIENGQGVVTDIGNDIPAIGESSTIMGDAERISAFEYLTDRTFKHIEFIIEVTNPLLDCKIRYPKFRCDPSDFFFIRESGKVTDIVLYDGPLVRFGNQEYVAGAVPPIVKAIGTCNSSLDWLMFRRLYLECLSSTSGLVTELTSIFDVDEGQTIADNDTDTMAFILPRGGIELSNSLTIHTFITNLLASGVPSIFQFPRKQFNGSRYSFSTSTYAQQAYGFSQGPMKYVTDGTLELNMFNGATQWTTPSALVISGRKVTQHEHIVDNTEALFKLVKASVDQANASPWLGYDSVISSVGSGGGVDGVVVYAVSKSQNHYRAYTSSSKLVIGRMDNGWTIWKDVTTAIDASNLSIQCFHYLGKEIVVVWASYGGTIIRHSTYDAGESIVSTVIATVNKDYPCAITPENNVEYIYYVSGTGPYNLMGKIYDSAMNVLEAEFTILSNANPIRLGGARSWKVGGQLRIGLLVSIGGTITQYESTDGKTFS